MTIIYATHQYQVYQDLISNELHVYESFKHNGERGIKNVITFKSLLRRQT